MPTDVRPLIEALESDAANEIKARRASHLKAELELYTSLSRKRERAIGLMIRRDVSADDRAGLAAYLREVDKQLDLLAADPATTSLH